MAFSAPGRRRRYFPRITHLEARSLLAAMVTSLGQDGHDLVGPDASQGSDGIQDLHLQLSGLAATVSQIEVQAPGGFEWATAPDPTGAALAEYFPSPTSGQGDLYINPQVKSDLAPAGTTLPLGGSTGSLIQLANGMNLTVTINYQGQTSPDVATVVVSNLISATDPMPVVATPGNVVGTFQVTDDGQDQTGQFYEQGFVHIVVTAPSGVVFDNATFAQVLWQLSDPVGTSWDSTTNTLYHNHIYATLRANTDNIVDIYFPPVRDEAPAGDSTAPTMILQVSIPGDNNVYATSFMGADWDLSAMTQPFDSQPAPAPPTTEAALRSDLMSNSPEYDTIDLPTNTTIVVTQPLEITHSVQIIGDNATLLFEQGDTMAWPASASGAIYVDTTSDANIQLGMSDFTITFDMSSPIRWSNPAGATPALFDPENNPEGIQHAVIDTRDSNTNSHITILSLNNLTIYGPPAFDGSSFSALQVQLVQSGDTVDQYVGEQDMDLIRANDADNGTISNSTFQGGSIEVFGGPWTMTGNTVLGSTADTYSPDAFGLHGPHDVLVEGNQVSQSDPAGREFRLVVLANSGFDNTISDNSIGGGAGQVGDEMSYSAGPGQFWGINSPEVILAESSYGVVFEGRPAAISGDGQLLVLSDVRAEAFPIYTGPGLVVSILEGVNADGTANMSLAGQWYQVAQQVSLSSDNSLELLMENPLPAMPQGGYYVIEITGGFINNSIVNNNLDLTGKSSTGIQLDGEDYGTRIVGNHFIGGTTYNTVYTGTAISLGAAINSAPSGNGAFPLPAGWTALPNLGAVIEDNTIEDSLGGIIIGVQHAGNYWAAYVVTPSETGRVYLTATVNDNTFVFDSSWLSTWAASYVADGNNPAENSTPPTVTIGSGFSAESPGPYGAPRFPWTVGNALTVNGNDQPIFVDPIENVVTVQSNSVETIGINGSVTSDSGVSGQAYAGIVNGVTVAPKLAAETYNNEPYYPFNLDNLDVSTTPAPSPTPTPTPTPSPTPTPTPSPTPTPTPSPPPSPPSAPSHLSASVSGLNQIVVAWQASRGASTYILERSLDAGTWSTIAMGLPGTSFTDTGLSYSTNYYYRVVSVSSAGTSAASLVVGAVTSAQPDSLAGQALSMTVARRRPFTLPVATFTDVNGATPGSRFIATINWGGGRSSRGTISGSNGSFAVLGTHTFETIGVNKVRVTVTMSVPDLAGVVITSTVKVSTLAQIRSSARAKAARQVVRKAIRRYRRPS